MVFGFGSYTPKFDKYDVPHPQYSADENDRIADYELLSPCEFYIELYNQCRSRRNLHTHMWVTGEWPKCSIWKTIFDHCRKWEEDDSAKNRESLDEILRFERGLVSDRRDAIKRNDVWKLRKESIDISNARFNAPLPDKLLRDVPKLRTQENVDSRGSHSDLK